MRSITQDPYPTSSLILVSVALFLLIFIYSSGRHDLISATLVVSSIVLFLTGIFLFTFSRNNIIDGELSSLLPIQGTINICRIASDLGIMGHAVIIPGNDVEKTRTMQFIPVSTYKNGNLVGDSFVSGPGGTGLLISPTGEPIFNYLKEKSKLLIPEQEEEILSLIQEIGVETLDLAEYIESQKSGDAYLLTFHKYQLLPGCLALQKESPACCLMNPCAICSLFAIILAEGIKHPITIERCYPDKKLEKVEILYSRIENNK